MLMVLILFKSFSHTYSYMLKIYEFRKNRNDIKERKRLDVIKPNNYFIAFFQDPTDAELELVFKLTGLEPEYIKEALEPEELPTIIQKRYCTIVKYLAPSKHEIVSPVLFVFIKNVLLVIYRPEIACITGIKNMLDRRKGKFLFKKGHTSMLTGMADKINDEYLNEINLIGKRVDAIEESLSYGNVNDKDIFNVYAMQLSLMQYRRALSYNLDVIRKLRKGYIKPFKDIDMLFDPIYNDVMEVLSMSKLHKEVIDTLLAAQNMLVSKRLNEIMKKIASIGVLLMVATVITGAYGMNLAYLPFASDKCSFFIIFAFISVISLIGYAFLKKIKWL